MRFKNRDEAAQQLVMMLERFEKEHPLVLAIPRGSVGMAAIVAEKLHAELDIVLVHKIGAPGNPEYAVGAVSEEGEIFRSSAIDFHNISHQYIDEEAQRQLTELKRRRKAYTPDRAAVDMTGRTVIIVDDGLATGSTMLAALRSIKGKNPRRVIVAAPVASPSAAYLIERECDQTIFLATPDNLWSISQFYDEFPQLSDEDVRTALRTAQPRPLQDTTRNLRIEAGPSISREVAIPLGPDESSMRAIEHLNGHLTLPSRAVGLVIFAHGSGSSRLSPRNQRVAHLLHENHLGTLLFDLLTDEEASARSYAFDIPFLAERLKIATHWVQRHAGIQRPLPLGYFGASTGAAAALWAGADFGREITAIVSRGGRPDLALPRLKEVRTPTLLLVGGRDEVVIGLNRNCLSTLAGAELEIIPDATHLFEETGALEQVAAHAARWFTKYFRMERRFFYGKEAA